MTKRFGAITLVAIVLVSALALFVSTQFARAGTSVAGSGGGIYWCTDSSSICTTAFGTFNAGAGLTMICWRDDRWATGAYSSNRWFYVQMDDGRVGFVHSSRVNNQTSTPNCSTNRAVSATLWATARNGQYIYEGWCLAFVHDAYLYGASYEIGSSSSAYQYWLNHPAQQVRTSSPNAPRGALVFWAGRPGYPDGHVVISLGNGWAMSTEERTTVPVHLMSIADRNSTMSVWYLGWIMP